MYLSDSYNRLCSIRRIWLCSSAPSIPSTKSYVNANSCICFNFVSELDGLIKSLLLDRLLLLISSLGSTQKNALNIL
jgi:hypothetical protein